MLLLLQPSAAWSQPREIPHSARALPTPPGALDLRIPVNGGDRLVAATLYLPRASGPVATLIAAHGASSPSRNSGNWARLAAQLNAARVALLVHDQPGTGDTPGTWREGAPLRASVDELKSIAAYLSEHPKIRGAKIGVIGWSRGGWTAPWAAVESPDISFVIANSAPAVSPNDANMHQRGEELLDQGYTPQQVEEVKTLRQLAWRYYGTGEGYQQARTAWQAAAERPWFKRLGFRPDIATPEQIKGPDYEYYREGTYDPAPILARLTKPVLVLLGSADRHIPITESIVGWRSAFAASANPDATLVVFGNSGHALKLVDGKERMSAAEGGHAAFAKLKEHPQSMPVMLDWLRRHI